MKRDPRACRTCRHFEQRAAIIEAELAGLTALSSAYGSVRSRDGLCSVWGRYAADTSLCYLHKPQQITGSVARSPHPDRTPSGPL